MIFNLPVTCFQQVAPTRHFPNIAAGHASTCRGIGHPMSPFELKVGDRTDAVLATVHSTLSLGLGYVSSTPGPIGCDLFVEIFMECTKFCQKNAKLDLKTNSWNMFEPLGSWVPYLTILNRKPMSRQESCLNLHDSWRCLIGFAQPCPCMHSRKNRL